MDHRLVDGQRVFLLCSPHGVDHLFVALPFVRTEDGHLVPEQTAAMECPSGAVASRPAGAAHGASRATELAAQAVEQANDASATEEQRQRRKRRI
jgi:hypothetical protein